MKYFIITYGCQMNESDSGRLAQYLSSKGWQTADNETRADLVVFNICSVRQSAVDRIYDKVRRLRLKNKKCRIIISGCVLANDQKKFKALGAEIRNIQQLPLKLIAKPKPKIKQTSYQKGISRPASTISKILTTRPSALTSTCRPPRLPLN